MRVVVAMSGGVDSSVAALLMQEAGHEVIGVSLQLWDYSTHDENKFGSCCSPDDLYDARRVAEKLEMPFYVVNAEAEFRREVVDAFVATYGQAETPSPCVHCNHRVKFRRLVQIARGLGADRLVTGHYVRSHRSAEGAVRLFKALDGAKDQSYFLFNLSQSVLSYLDFPLGTLTKAEVRARASAIGLPTASKHESQELCFIPENDYVAFLAGGGGEMPEGDIVDVAGVVLGRHRGLHRHTIGQRKGLGIAASEPLYVLGMDSASNRLIVGSNQALFLDGLLARDVVWLQGKPPEDLHLWARIRSRAREARMTLHPAESDGEWTVQFEEPQRAISPGQAVVFYNGDELLGGGWIVSPLDHSVPRAAFDV